MTTVAVRPMPRVAAPKRPRWETPERLRILTIASVAVTVVLALVVAAYARTTRDDIAAIGHRTGPAVTATADLGFAFADMDAQLANVLLAGADPNLAGVRDTALKTFEQRRRQVDADLQQATTVAGANADSIRSLLDQFGRYQALAANTLQLNDIDKAPAGRPSARTLQSYRDATDSVRNMLTIARQLTESNGNVLQHDYRHSRSATTAARIWSVLLGMLALALLIWLQALLRLRHRRRVNPALAAASLLVVALMVGGFAANAAAAQRLRVAKEDAFDSLIALRLAHSDSSDANAYESRYLLDPQRTQMYESGFLASSEQLAQLGAHTVPEYNAWLDQALASYQTDKKVTFSGFLGAEAGNVTFPGERAAVDTMLTTYQTYQHDDLQIRSKANDLPAAIAFDTGTAPGTSNYDFNQFDKALGSVIDINQHAFDAAIADSEDDLGGWTAWLPYGAAALVAVLALLGIRPRLAEYR
ncbi:hypothetical protein [Nocardia arthritidis]|uniref:Uncharacterized protein n=1 Tax=Nocardia arthritidis TaxID=228602 RepID=A0A6G9Y7E6_9NOCA|nr:hypothetical protein [Nocardia arthritidis]QIS09142.1 hypothetical protein F5544_06155 [Nocardia arthritidis]